VEEEQSYEGEERSTKRSRNRRLSWKKKRPLQKFELYVEVVVHKKGGERRIGEKSGQSLKSRKIIGDRRSTYEHF